MITTSEGHYKVAKRLVGQADLVFMGTYGFNDHDDHVKDFLKHVKSQQIDAYGLIGLYYFMPCSKYCNDCAVKWLTSLVKCHRSIKRHHHVKWRAINRSHLKLIAVRQPTVAGPLYKAIIGGRNMTGSDWVDLSYEIAGDEIKTLIKFGLNEWKSAKAFNEDLIFKLADAFGIPDDFVSTVLESDE